MKTKAHVRRPLRRNVASRLLEPLESRMLLSGNVTASISNGQLYLQGNNLNNSVIIDQAALAATQFRVASGDGTTTINGKSGPQTFSGVNGLVINIGAGNDTVVLQNASVANNVQITGANGNQVVTLNNVTLGGNFSLTNGGGQNSTTLNNSTIVGNVAVNAGAGFNCQGWSCWGAPAFTDANELFTLSGTVVGNNVSVSNVSGETTTDIESSIVGNNLTVTNGASSYGNCGFHCGSAAAGDLFILNSGSVIVNNVSITNASDGNSTVIEGNAIILGNLTVNNVVGTSAQCGFSALCSGNLANASDAFTLNDASIAGNVVLSNISDGASADIENAAINGGLTINNGVGSYGQGFTSCRGQTSANFGDLLYMSSTTVLSAITISNGSTYNSTDIEYSTLGASLTVANGLNLNGSSGGNSCGNNSCGGGSCGNNSYGGNSCGNNSCGGNSCGNNSYGGNSCGGSSYGGNSCGGGNSVYTTDLFTINGSTLGGSLSVANASGYTNTAITATAISLNATITNANGLADFTMTASSIGANLSFIAGLGVTNVSVTSSIIALNANISVSSGATIVFAPSQVDGTLAITV